MFIKRMWYGPEREGYSLCVPTLFIEASTVIAQEIIDAVNYVKEQKKVTRVYLGAGRISPVVFIGAPFIVSYCKEHGIELCVESEAFKAVNLPKEILDFATVICTVYPPSGFFKTNKVLWKVDDFNQVLIFKPSAGVTTSLQELDSGMFPEDEEIPLPDFLRS